MASYTPQVSVSNRFSALEGYNPSVAQPRSNAAAVQPRKIVRFEDPRKSQYVSFAKPTADERQADKPPTLLKVCLFVGTALLGLWLNFRGTSFNAVAFKPNQNQTDAKITTLVKPCLPVAGFPNFAQGINVENRDAKHEMNRIARYLDQGLSGDPENWLIQALGGQAVYDQFPKLAAKDVKGDFPPRVNPEALVYPIMRGETSTGRPFIVIKHKNIDTGVVYGGVFYRKNYSWGGFQENIIRNTAIDIPDIQAISLLAMGLPCEGTFGRTYYSRYELSCAPVTDPKIIEDWNWWKDSKE